MDGEVNWRDGRVVVVLRVEEEEEEERKVAICGDEDANVVAIAAMQSSPLPQLPTTFISLTWHRFSGV